MITTPSRPPPRNSTSTWPECCSSTSAATSPSRPNASTRTPRSTSRRSATTTSRVAGHSTKTSASTATRPGSNARRRRAKAPNQLSPANHNMPSWPATVRCLMTKPYPPLPGELEEKSGKCAVICLQARTKLDATSSVCLLGSLNLPPVYAWRQSCVRPSIRCLEL